MNRTLLIIIGTVVFALAVGRTVKQWTEPAITVAFEESYPGKFTVVRVDGNPAEAGLETGDVVAVINGEPIYTLAELERSLYQNEPGDRVLLTVYRQGYYDDISFAVDHRLERDLLVKLLKMLVGLIYFGVGLFIVFQRPRDSRAVVFYLLSLCLTLYLYPEASFARRGIARFVERGVSLLFLWIPALFLHFFCIFPWEKDLIRQHRWILGVLYLPSLVFYILFLLNPYEMPTLNNVHALFRGVYLALGLAALLHSYAVSTTPALKKQAGLIVWGSIFGVLPYLLYSFGYPFLAMRDQLIGDMSFTPLIYASFIFMGAVPLAIAYSILKHRLFDIDVILRRGIVYTFLTVLIIALYLLVVGYFGNMLRGVTGIDSTYITIAFTLVVALLFNPLKVRIQRVIDRVFYRERYNYSQILLEMTENLNLIIELDQLVVSFLDRVVDTMKLSGGHVFIEDRDEESFSSRYARGPDRESGEVCRVSADSVLVGKLSSGSPLDLSGGGLEKLCEELPHEERRVVEALKPALVIPFMFAGRLIGWASFSEKLSGEIFSQEDIDLLATVSRQASIAVENARTYEDLKQTHDRLLKTERLAVIGEMAARIAHEIRNPLASIKMNIQILGRKMKLPHPDDEEYLDITRKEIDRLNTVLREILNYSKPVTLSTQLTSVNTLVHETLHQVFPNHFEDGIEIVEKFSDRLPEISLDRGKIKQALLNILVNAQDAVGSEGTITTATDLIDRDGEWCARIDVTNSGRGLDEEAARRVFEPFYTTKAKGVGLGLANAKRYVEEHGGKIRIWTKPEGPTTFSMFLPVVRGG